MPALVDAVDAIVVAAGRSTRMGGPDKLAAPIAGRPLLAWTLDAIAAAPGVERIVVVTAPDRVAGIAASPWLPAAVTAVVAGGERRQESVYNGFLALDGSESDEARVILVHDGARPLVSPGLVSRVANAAAHHGAAIPILPVAETLKRVDGDFVGTTVDRAGLGSAQTPQGVRHGILRAAYARFPAAGPETWTDEASLLEAIGVPVRVVVGDPLNRKVTVPNDLVWAGDGLGRTGPPRTGIGQDSHPFGPDAPLILGGVQIDGAPRLFGHSDGDVILHAVGDALLGAAALGDLGQMFPSDARTPRGIASGELVRAVHSRLAASGFRPISIDVTVIAARPRLGSHLGAMRRSIALLVGLADEQVNVKASSGNLDGPEGAGRSISAVALATVVSVR
jgi:2-C-methyl-D-erythritol 4-phosphate cytidylyltransferase/2-C-methyl-D-erythritol 2,4-cyclodiphosphate synthase